MPFDIPSFLYCSHPLIRAWIWMKRSTRSQIFAYQVHSTNMCIPGIRVLAGDEVPKTQTPAKYQHPAFDQQILSCTRRRLHSGIPACRWSPPMLMSLQRFWVVFFFFITSFYNKLKNVSWEYDRLNGWNSTLQAAWYIRHVRIIWFCGRNVRYNY